jgi:perosamine synthetase
MSPIIHHTFGPLVTRNQFLQCWWLQWKPWQHIKGNDIALLKQKVGMHFGKTAYTFYNGRQALLATLKAMQLCPGDEVIIQAYTCIVVPNAIIAAGGIPVYCDIDAHTLNIDPQNITKKITKRTKAIICQHTFGIPADTQSIQKICREHGLLFIEDCAHSIPVDRTSAPIGLHADVTIVSFGRDKALSGITGGMTLTNIPALQSAIAAEEEQAEHVSKWHIQKLLGYAIHYYAAKQLPTHTLFKAYMYIIGKLSVLPKILEPEEKKGIMQHTLQKMPNACATLALYQWRSLAALNTHRRSISTLYQKELTNHPCNSINTTNCTALQKFPVLIQNRDAALQSLKKMGIYLQDGWSGSVINPRDAYAKTVYYAEGSCPVAEYISAHIVSFPTHPTMSMLSGIQLLHAVRPYLQPTDNAS